MAFLVTTPTPPHQHSPFYSILSPHYHQTHLSLFFKPLSCHSSTHSSSTSTSSSSSTQTPRRINLDDDTYKKKKWRKPRPSFYDQVHEKWCVRQPISQDKKFPWQEVKDGEKDESFDGKVSKVKSIGLVSSSFDEKSKFGDTHLRNYEKSDGKGVNFGGRKGFGGTLLEKEEESEGKYVNFGGRKSFGNAHLGIEEENDVNDDDEVVDYEDIFVRDVERIAKKSVYFGEGSKLRDVYLSKLEKNGRKVGNFGGGSGFGKGHLGKVEKCDDKGEKRDDNVVSNMLGYVEGVESKGDVVGEEKDYRDNSLVVPAFAKENKIEGAHVGYQVKNDQDNGRESYDVVNFGGGLVNDVGVDDYDSLEVDESDGDVERKTVKDARVLDREFDFKLNIAKDERAKGGSEGSLEEEGDAERLPWAVENGSIERRKRSKTELSEKMIPEHELKRLRNVSLRMIERIKVGSAGITQDLVDTIRQKWEIDEVVKLKFEGPSKQNMKRIHETLEMKTGGLVIWRSGSSMAIYRGLNYKLGCVKTYAREKGVEIDISAQREKSAFESMRIPRGISEEECMEASEFNSILDELGPRYEDWSGPPPFPVDADLLPGLVPGYKPPFRLLPHGLRSALRDQQTTEIRRIARHMPPHFALGRSRELQGLAAALVKLWEKSAIAKIAIKRGVLNTNNERIAEQLKYLTGGTLLSRNKDFIVLYRGNDFLPPNVTKALKEREQLTKLQYQEEDARRYASTLISSNSNNKKVPVVAGTLAETVAATSRWGKQPSKEELEKMMEESAVARRASLIRYLQNKFAIAKRKLKMAESALAKVQESIDPEELPTDLETLTDEERLVFRKIGLSMKPFLLLGRREVFDGTIENMHLHWKFREVVKIIVKGKYLAQVKHIAIALEAESGGVVVSIDKTLKGYAIIIYRGKNYQRPLQIRPKNLLSKRQALARSIELQRREALKHHVADLQEQMDLLKSELEDVKDRREVDDKTFYEKLDDPSHPSDDDIEEDEGEESDLQVYDSGDENDTLGDSN